MSPPHRGTTREQLAALIEATQAVASSLDLEAVLQAIVREAASVSGAPVVRLFLLDEEGGLLRCRVGIGLPMEMERGLAIPVGESFSGQVAAAGEPVAVPDCREDPRLRYPEHASTYHLISYLGLPVKLQDRLFGVLVFNTNAPRVYRKDEVRFLSVFARQAALAIQNARLYEAVHRHAADLEARVQERTAALEGALRVKAEFLANMSHELRTPLNSILGFSDLLRDQEFGSLNEKQARFLENIRKGGQHLLALVTDLLDLADVEAGNLRLRLETFDLREVLDPLMDGVRPKAAEKGLSIELHMQSGSHRLAADPGRLSQILDNLLSNALKFTPEGGTNTVEARRMTGQSGDPAIGQSGTSSECQGAQLPDFLEIAVRDSGIEIRSEDLPRLFRPLTQLEPTYTKRFQGTGLGLALTHRLVALHGGHIRAESDGEGRGSTFTVFLPVHGPGGAPRGAGVRHNHPGG